MDYFKLTFERAKKENLNFDAIVEMFGSLADADTICNYLTALYFDYTRSLLMLKEVQQPTFEQIDNELFWLRNVIEAFRKTRKPNGRVRIEM